MNNNVASTFAAYLAASAVSGRATSAALNGGSDYALYLAANKAQDELAKAHKAWRDAVAAMSA